MGDRCSFLIGRKRTSVRASLFFNVVVGVRIDGSSSRKCKKTVLFLSSFSLPSLRESSVDVRAGMAENACQRSVSRRVRLSLPASVVPSTTLFCLARLSTLSVARSSFSEQERCQHQSPSNGSQVLSNVSKIK